VFDLAYGGDFGEINRDTLIVPGGAGLRQPDRAERVAKWISSRANEVRRIATVCTGIYMVAPTGSAATTRVNAMLRYAWASSRLGGSDSSTRRAVAGSSTSR